MSNGFLKLNRKDRTNWLLQHYPNAFLLLSYIALHARYTNDDLDGLLIGDAIIGNPKLCGLTRKKYRGALDKLIEFGFIEIVYCQKAKKSKTQKRAIKRAIKGQVVNLLDNSVWDINPQIINDEGAIKREMKGPSKGHKQERTRKNKEQTTPPSPSKGERVAVFPFLENLGLSDSDLQCLMQYPEERLRLAIEYSKIEPPKTTLIRLLIWHCNEASPPIASPKVKFTEQQLAAIKFNDEIKTLISKELYQKNVEDISLQRYHLWNGLTSTPISLKNSLQQVLEDFKEAKKLMRGKADQHSG